MLEPGRHKDSNASEGSEDSEMQEGRRRLGTVAGDAGGYHQQHGNGSSRASPMPNKPKKTTADFKNIRIIGEGAFGQVRLSTDLETGQEVAIKVLDKKHIIKEKKVEWVEREKCILDKLRHPSIVTLFYTFQDRDSLYAAEIVLALEYIHSMGIVHRDLKPENILISADGHLKLIDFGTAKEIGTGRDARAKSFCGTAEYMSPELLQSKAGLTSDLWALGCVIYQMLSGRCPFKARAMMQMFNIINARDILYPEGFPRIGMELVESLIVLDPDRRLGAPAVGGYTALKNHAFFAGVPWNAIYAAPPPAFHAPEYPIVWPPPPPEEQMPQEEPPEVTERRQAEEERKRKLEEQKKSQWSQFLIPNQELIVETGLIMKKKGLFSRKRMLFITDYPRIFYVDPEKMIQKGEIPWTGTITVEIKNSRSFFIHTPNRVYILEDINNTAQRWAEAINRLKAQVAARQGTDAKPAAP